MSEPKSEYKVEVKNLTKYFGDLHVLNDISFNVRKGEFICIVGPTGCGKTTFLNLLTRIYMPSKGDLLIDGESADPKKHNLAFVFQEPSSIPWRTRWFAFGRRQAARCCLLPTTLRRLFTWPNAF